MEWPHKRKEGTVRMTGLNCIKSRTQFPVCCHGDHRPSLSDVGCETPFLMSTCTLMHSQPEKSPEWTQTWDNARQSTCVYVETTDLYMLSHSFSFPLLNSLTTILIHFSFVKPALIILYNFKPWVWEFLFLLYLSHFIFPPVCSPLPHHLFSFLSSTQRTLGPIIWPRPPPSPCHYTHWLSCHSVPVATL